MARILISEPRPQVRAMLKRIVTRLGHEPVLGRVPAPEHFAGFDVYILDTAGSLGPTLARAARQAAREADQSLPIVGIGAEPLPEVFKTLGIEPDVFLLKPLTMEQLRDAIERVLAQSA
jgi:CheY-like chemotaxis protein